MIKEVHNLIILDRSGSMCSIAAQAIAGVNETIGTIRAAAKKNPEITQFVTVTSFCGCCIRNFCKNTPVERVGTFSSTDYDPCCSTPLYDAMGSSLTELRKAVAPKGSEVAVSVTIITDGYENASREWNESSIKALVKLLKADGWLFAYIGANQDVKAVSFNLSIDNCMAFEATPEDTEEMFRKERSARMRWNSRIAETPTAGLCNCEYFDDL